jgi:superfamily II DNA/RNA helicase
MRTILKVLATPSQSFFFSATMEHKVKALIDTFVHEPITISVKSGDTSSNVDQNVVGYRNHSEKIEKLHEILTHVDTKKVLVFDETKRSVEKLHPWRQKPRSANTCSQQV